MNRRSRLLGPITSRGYLAHASAAGAVQFVTFRLHDSLPAEVLHRLAHEKDRLQRQRMIERDLDRASGSCILREPDAAGIVEEALLHRDGRIFDLLAWVVMPNHVHFLARMLDDTAIAATMRGLKSYTSRRINECRSTRGSVWQRDFFDRQALDPDSQIRFAHYIEENPVKAGLCLRREDWRFSSAWNGRRDRTL